MKNYQFVGFCLIFCLLSLTFVSCSDDSDELVSSIELNEDMQTRLNDTVGPVGPQGFGLRDIILI